MKKALAFDDVLIVPGFSSIKSRRDVDLSVDFMGEKLTLPVLSAPMDTVTNTTLAIELHKAGGLATLHRFQPIGSNVKEFLDVTEATGRSPIVSVGLNDSERLDALVYVGANKVLLDVAHGGMKVNSEWIFNVNSKYPHLYLMVGNFSIARQIEMIVYEANAEDLNERLVWRVGVGGGSACTTRVKTGCGMPTLASIMDFAAQDNNEIIIGDGGFKTPGDVAKGLAAGASVVMLGGMLAGTDESPGEQTLGGLGAVPRKKFRGSAAASSYKDQVKEWSTAEGEEFYIPLKGPVKNILAEIEGGLRSALSYVGASNLTEFRKNATFVEVTSNGHAESSAHGKKA